MSYGWQIFDENGRLTADHTVVMSRRLGTYDIPYIKVYNFKGWSTSFTANFNGGTPFVHCTLIAGLNPPTDGGVYAPVIPAVSISGNKVTLSYDVRQISYPDDLGTFMYVGAIRVHYGVYNQ